MHTRRESFAKFERGSSARSLIRGSSFDRGLSVLLCDFDSTAINLSTNFAECSANVCFECFTDYKVLHEPLKL